MRTATRPQSIYVNVPCAEKFDAMPPAEGGKMCGSCKHLVTDFTEWKQEDIVTFLQSRNGERVCGQFTSQQLAPTSERKNLFRNLKISVVAAIALWFSKTEVKAQDVVVADKTPGSVTVSDSVVVVVKAEVKSNGRILQGGDVVALNADGDTIATAEIANGRFVMNVPVGSVREQFTIKVNARGYREYTIPDYSSAAGNVIAVELQKKGRLFRKKQTGYRVVGCPSF